MSYRILTKNAVENTNIDGARDHNFNAGRRSGIVKGALNQGNFFASSSNTIVLDTCELRLCGHRVVIDEAKSISFHNQPSVSIRYSLVAQIIVDNDGGVSFDLHAQTSSTALVQDNLDTNGSGTYELEIGRFTQLTDGTITDVVRTADLITGGAGGGDSEYIRIGTVTTNKISPELDADVDIENTINPDDNKPQTNFTFNLPTSVGTVVSVNGEEKTSINTDITPVASSENLITSGGVHDYPAVTFAESERQKSKNLFNANDVIFDNSTYGYIPIKNVDNLYCLSLQNDRGGDLENISFGVCKDPTSPSSVTEQGFFWIIDGGNKIVSVDVSNITNRPYVFFYPKNQHTLDLVLARFDVQIEEGSVATDYQPYNGAIVHEKELAGVEHIETIYDMSSSNKNIINNTAYTAGIKIGTTVNLDMSVYKKLKIYARRESDVLLTTIDLDNDLVNVYPSNVIMDISANYYVYHSYGINKNTNTFTFSKGGYQYVDSETYTPRVLEAADSGNLIYRIEGVR